MNFMNNIINSINHFGFYQDKIEPDYSFAKFANYITNLKIPIDTSWKQEKGYSYDISNFIDKENKNFIEKFAKNFFYKNKWLNKILINPRILKIEISRSEYNVKAKINPTHAMLWHRDLDDFFSQIKVFIPLHKVNIDNGAFSYAEKSICKINQKLVDVKLVNKLRFNNDPYLAEDKIRITNETFLKYFLNKIRVFEGNLGDILFIDTNNCYHKGAQILRQGLQRNMLVFHFGGITHGWNDHSSYNIFEKILVRVLRMFKSIQLRFQGGLIQKNILLD